MATTVDGIDERGEETIWANLCPRPGDLDRFGHVGHSRILDLFEQGRWEWARKNGWPGEKGSVIVVPIVESITVRFRAQLFLQPVRVATWQDSSRMQHHTPEASYRMWLKQILERWHDETWSPAGEADLSLGFWNRQESRLVSLAEFIESWGGIMQWLWQILSDSSTGLYVNADGPGSWRPLPYRHLLKWIGHYQAVLTSYGLRRGDRVLLPFGNSEHHLSAFLAMVGMGVIPLSIKTWQTAGSRRAYRDYLQNLGVLFSPKALIDDGEFDPGENFTIGRIPLPRSLPVTSEVLILDDAQWRLRGNDDSDDSLVFVQFSSGSTQFPKGVPITQRALRQQLTDLMLHDRRPAGAPIYNWLPLHHDMGLIGGTLSALASGSDLFLGRPEDFIMNPVGWIDDLSKFKIYATAVPHFALALFLRRYQQEKTVNHSVGKAWDLSHLQALYVGSDPIDYTTLDDFIKILAPFGLDPSAIIPCYGMAEAVLMVSGRPFRSKHSIRAAPIFPKRSYVSLGPPFPGVDVHIELIDADGAYPSGEIWLKSQCFPPTYFDGSPLLNNEGYFPTGDYGAFVDGDIYCIGRLGDRLKISGQSFAASDLEYLIGKIAGVRPGRVCAVEVHDTIHICFEPSSMWLAPSSILKLRKSIADECRSALGVGISLGNIHILPKGKLPKTSSGKLQRHAIRRSLERREFRSKGPLMLWVAHVRGLTAKLAVFGRYL